MHNFSELIYRSSSFINATLESATKTIIYELQESGSTIHVKNLQMINLQKTFFVIGAFSFFEALIQTNLNCKNGFEEAKNILKNNNDFLLSEKFEEAQDIINVLKHGRGRSYDKLLNKTNRVIKIKIKGENDFYFNEGNVDEINSLIEVDDNFILEMSEIISETTEAIYKYTHIYF